MPIFVTSAIDTNHFAIIRQPFKTTRTTANRFLSCVLIAYLKQFGSGYEWNWFLIRMKRLKAYLKDGINVAAVMCLGDTISQFFFDKKSLDEWDAGRTLRFGIVGLVFVGPTLRRWYHFLESRVPKTYSPMRRGVTKMLVDQTLFAPPFTMAMSFLVPLSNGEPIDRIRQRILDSYLSILVRNYMLWPAAQMLNFRFVPLGYQVLYAQFIALVWNCYLSMILNS